ncbi:reverse transcriptase domain-containing protein [Trichonephila clavipes]|nr:reverse transcriptase domain-containing protein [Trichonephila clavipes]
MVFDASSKGRDCKSLNECLYVGPPLNPPIIDVISRFREYEHAFCRAFLTIGIAEEDRDYLKFFWFQNDGDAKSYKMRMNRVPFGVTLSSFILAATIKFHIRKYKEDYRETYEMLDTSFYVDDLFAGSSESVNKAFDLSKNAIEILKDANMNLRKFKTNSKELRKLWNENGKASNYKQFVSNRVIEIQSNSDPSDWHHCSGRENPADYVSRGANLETIINSQFWMYGPQWLRTTENTTGRKT